MLLLVEGMEGRGEWDKRRGKGRREGEERRGEERRGEKGRKREGEERCTHNQLTFYNVHVKRVSVTASSLHNNIKLPWQQ